MPAATHARHRRGANPVKNVATGGIAQRINGAIATERVRTTGRPLVLPRDPFQSDILPTEGFSSLKQIVRVAPHPDLPARPKQHQAVRRQTVLFAVQKKTDYGQTVRLVGDSSDLGCWSMDGAIELLWGEGHEWHAHVQLPPGTHTFKFVLVDSAGLVQWESTENRQIEICPMTASTQYCTRWDSAMAQTSSAPLMRRPEAQVALSAASQHPALRLSAANGGRSAGRPAASSRGAVGTSGRQATGVSTAASARGRQAAGASAAVAAGLARMADGASTSGRAAAAAAVSIPAGGASGKAAPARLDIFALCGVKGKLWKVDLGGMDDVWGVFGRGSSSSSSSSSQPAQAKAVAPTPAAAAHRHGGSNGASSSGRVAAAPLPGRHAAPSPKAAPQLRPAAAQAAAAAVAAPTAAAATAATPVKAPSAAQQQAAEARQKLQHLLGGGTAAAAAAAAAVATRRAAAAEEASLMTALALPEAPARGVARKLRPDERAALMRKAQWSSDDGCLPAGARPVVLEATMQQKMAMLFTGLITGDMSSMPLW